MKLNPVFVVAMAIAMFAGLMVSAYDSQAYAAKSDASKQFCYSELSYNYNNLCSSKSGDCHKEQKADPYADSKCSKRDSKP